MISKLSERLTKKLLKNSNTSEEERELYIYGFFMLLSHLMYFILASFFGLIFGCFIESAVFYIAFQFIRRYAGGYHASTEMRCEIMSALSILLCIAAIRAAKTINMQTPLLVITALSALSIFILCPLDTPEKPLSDKELKYFRKISRLILSVISAAVVISYCFSFNYVFSPCCLSLILESILLISGRIQKAVMIKKNIQ